MRHILTEISPKFKLRIKFVLKRFVKRAPELLLKTRKQICLNEMLTDWSKKCGLTQCKQIIKLPILFNFRWLI